MCFVTLKHGSPFPPTAGGTGAWVIISAETKMAASGAAATFGRPDVSRQKRAEKPSKFAETIRKVCPIGPFRPIYTNNESRTSLAPVPV